MQLEKANKLLFKIQTMLNAVSDGEGNLSKLENDLLLSYIRELYDSIVPIPEETDTRRESRSVAQTRPKPVQIEQNPQPTIPFSEPAEPESLVTSDEQPEPVPQPTDVADALSNVEASESANLENSAPTVQKVAPENDMTALEQLFNEEERTDLAARLGYRPIDKIEAAMGINERISAIQVLFGGNEKLFAQTCETLNRMPTLGQAKDFLLSGVALEQNWAEEEYREKAILFIKLVKRRFV